MAELGAFFGNPNIQRQGARARALAGQRDVNTLPDPLTYAVMQGLLGTRPDEMGFSVLNPDYEKIKKVAEPAFALGLLGQAAPVLAPLTKGLPVGASVKNVGEDLLSYRGSHKAPNAKRYGATLDDLTKILPDDVYSQEGKRLYGYGDRLIDSEWRTAALKTRGKPNAEIEIFRAVPKGVKEINDGDWVSTSKAYAKTHGESTLNGEYDIISKKVKAKTLSTEGYPYEYGYNEVPNFPRQEALDTAQRNAALPVEKGGLGLPKDNTPEMRAEAMGFDVDAYHGTNTPDILAFDPSLVGKQSGGNLKASFFADRPSAANYYINETPENVVIKPQYAEEYNKIYSKFTNDEAKAIEKFNETYDKNIRSTVQIPWDEANPEVLALKNQARKSADDYFAKYFDEDIVQNPKYFDKNPEGLVYPVKLNTKGLMDYDAGGATWTPYQDQRIKSLLAQEGRTLEDVGGVNISNSYDADVGQKIGVYGIADPSRIRSRFAAFDPMRRNEPDLLAGVLPLGLLTDEDQRNKLYEMFPSLLGQ